MTNQDNNLINAASSAFLQKQAENKIAEIEREKEAKEVFAKESAQVKELFVAKFGIEPAKVEGKKILVDDNTYIYCRNPFANHIPNIDWKIIRECKNIEKEGFECSAVSDEWMTSLSNLGRFLADETIGELCWTCQKVITPTETPSIPTTEEQLLNLFKRLIAENSYQG